MSDVWWCSGCRRLLRCMVLVPWLGLGSVTEAQNPAVPIAGQLPRIVTHPQSQWLSVGDRATLISRAAGEEPLVYQWMREGEPLAGATNATLTVEKLRFTHEGTYAVVVRNAWGTVTSSAAYLRVLPVPGLAAAWSFDETSGSVAHDTVGLLDGVLSAGATFVPGGVSGNAIRLDRLANGHVSMGDVLALVETNFSIVTWLRLNKGDRTENSVFVAKHEAYFNNGYFGVVNRSNPILGQDDKAFFFAGDPTSGPTSSTSVNDGQWHQVVAVHEHGGENRLYVDGRLEAAVQSLPVELSPASFLIGGVSYSSLPRGMFNGWLDEIQVYTQALESGEISYLFANPAHLLSGLIYKRELPAEYTPGNELKVRLTAPPNAVLPTGSAYAVEESPPAGWTVTAVGAGGSYDLKNHEVKFGPFFSEQPPVLTYSLRPPPEAHDVARVMGLLSVGGVERIVQGATSVAPTAAALSGSPWGSAVRSLPAGVLSNEIFQVSIAVKPVVDVSAYALEERILGSVLITNVSEQGVLDRAAQTIRWGPFVDHQPRQLTYEVSAGGPAPGEIAFKGVVSFDGHNFLIDGPARVRPAIRLELPKLTAPATFEFAIPVGLAGASLILVSTNLETWLPMAVTNQMDVFRLVDREWDVFPHRFFRIGSQ